MVAHGALKAGRAGYRVGAYSLIYLSVMIGNPFVLLSNIFMAVNNISPESYKVNCLADFLGRLMKACAADIDEEERRLES